MTPSVVPAGYSLRRPTLEHLSPVADLLRAADLAEIGEVGLQEDWLRDDWSRPRFDLATDAWMLLAQDGSVAGFAQAYEEEQSGSIDANAVVHPAHRGRGIGGRLVDLVEGRARDAIPRSRDGRVRIHLDATAKDPAGRELLEGRGYRPVRRSLHLWIELSGDVPQPVPPRGVIVRAFAHGNDEPSVHRVLMESFEDHWGFEADTLEDWIASETAKPSHEPSLWFVAEVDGEVVGAVLGLVREGRGWVEDLGVLERHRGRGIGSTLLRRAFAAFAARGCDGAGLDVDAGNETGALAVYERAGMRVKQAYDLFEKTLTA